MPQFIVHEKIDSLFDGKDSPYQKGGYRIFLEKEDVLKHLLKRIAYAMSSWKLSDWESSTMNPLASLREWHVIECELNQGKGKTFDATWWLILYLTYFSHTKTKSGNIHANFGIIDYPFEIKKK